MVIRGLFLLLRTLFWAADLLSSVLSRFCRMAQYPVGSLYPFTAGGGMAIVGAVAPLGMFRSAWDVSFCRSSVKSEGIPHFVLIYIPWEKPNLFVLGWISYQEVVAKLEGLQRATAVTETRELGDDRRLQELKL